MIRNKSDILKHLLVSYFDIFTLLIKLDFRLAFSILSFYYHIPKKDNFTNFFPGYLYITEMNAFNLAFHAALDTFINSVNALLNTLGSSVEMWFVSSTAMWSGHPIEGK